MANTLTDLAADLYISRDIIARELVGIIPSVLINKENLGSRAAKNQTIRSHFTRPSSAGDITESMTIPQGTDQTVDNKQLTMTKFRSVLIPWTGEDVKFVNAGSGFVPIRTDQVTQAMRTLVNEIEVDLATEAKNNSSRAVGVAGTTPFASNFNITADARKVLVDNGVPDDGQWSMVFDTAAGVKMRSLPTLQKANEAGNDELLRQGTLLNLNGFMLKESAGIQTHVIGTENAAFVTSGADAVGTESISVITGTGTWTVGDLAINQESNRDANQYIVKTALSGAGELVIQEPGLQIAWESGDSVENGSAGYVGNVAFHRSAIELAMRAPAMPEGGDAATDSMIIADDHSGLVFEIRIYGGYHKQVIEVGAAWGFKAWLPAYIVTVLG